MFSPGSFKPASFQPASFKMPAAATSSGASSGGVWYPPAITTEYQQPRGMRVIDLCVLAYGAGLVHQPR